MKLKKENIEQIYVGESGSIRKEFVVKLVVLAVLPLCIYCGQEDKER